MVCMVAYSTKKPISTGKTTMAILFGPESIKKTRDGATEIFQLQASMRQPKYKLKLKPQAFSD